MYVGFDDTDVAGADRGTGKLARWFGEKLPHGTKLFGTVRQQLPVLEGIPYTSQNSAACLIIDNVDPDGMEELINLAAAHIHDHFIDGSDPGLCLVSEGSEAETNLCNFGRMASSRIVTQKEAMDAARTIHLSGHGGTNDGIIGAAAGVGLTLSGWSGRFIEFGGLRNFNTMVSVRDLEDHGIRVLSVDRNAMVPALDDIVDTRDWLRPRLWGGSAVLPVETSGPGAWRSTAGKNKH